MLIDTHAHYDSERFKADRHELLAALPENGVEKIINIGCDLKTSRASVRLAERYSHVFATVGAHPHYAKGLNDGVVRELEKMCEHKKVVGFGEIGLDFFHNFSPPQTQRLWFKRLLQLAAELELPAIIHSRDANDEVFAEIKASPVRCGVIHAFSGDAALAHAYVKLGFHIGIGGVVTFKKADALKAAVEVVPFDKILLETDCPYLTPEPHRGKRNESPYIRYIAETVGEIKGKTADEICRITADNARELFGI